MFAKGKSEKLSYKLLAKIKVSIEHRVFKGSYFSVFLSIAGVSVQIWGSLLVMDTLWAAHPQDAHGCCGLHIYSSFPRETLSNPSSPQRFRHLELTALTCR